MIATLLRFKTMAKRVSSRSGPCRRTSSAPPEGGYQVEAACSSTAPASATDLAVSNPLPMAPGLIPRARNFHPPESRELAAIYAGLSANELCFFAEVAWFTNDHDYHLAAIAGFDALVFHARELLDDRAAGLVEQLSSAWKSRFESESRADEIYLTRAALAEDLLRSDRSDSEIFESHCSDLSNCGTKECLSVRNLIEQGLDDTIRKLFRIGECLGQGIHPRPTYRRLSVRQPAAAAPSAATPASLGEFLFEGRIRRDAVPHLADLPSLPLFPPTEAECGKWKRELEQRCRLAGLRLGPRPSENAQFIENLRADPEVVDEFLARARTYLTAAAAAEFISDAAAHEFAPNGYLDIGFRKEDRSVLRRGFEPVILPRGKLLLIIMQLIKAGARGRMPRDLLMECWEEGDAPSSETLQSHISTLRGLIRPIQVNVSAPDNTYRLIPLECARE